MRVPRTLEERKRNPQGKDRVIKHFFILVVDCLSRFCYGKPLPEQINQNTLRKAFNEMFLEKMPNFNVLRCDADGSWWKIRGYLAQKGVFLFLKRGRRSLSLVDIYMKYIKTKIISYLKIYPTANFPNLLKAVLDSYNHTFSDKINGKPAELNSNYFDPVLRRRLYKNQPALQPFETWFKDQLKLQSRSLKPRTGELKNRDDLRVSDLVFVLYREKRLQRNWSRKTERILYRVARVVTAHGKPFTYQLRDVMTNELVPGYFSGDVSHLTSNYCSFYSLIKT